MTRPAPPDKTAQLDRLHQARAEIRSLIDTTLANGVPELFLVEEQYRLALLAAETEFVEEFIGNHRPRGWLGRRVGPIPRPEHRAAHLTRPLGHGHEQAGHGQLSRSATAAMPGSMARSPTWPNPSTS